MLYPQRKIIRLQDYDYRQNGAYFCTLCVHKAHRTKNVFSRIEDGAVQLTRFGEVVESCWFDIPNHRKAVILDAFVIMPNHIHCLLFLDGDLNEQSNVGSGAKGALGAVIGSFKSAVKREVDVLRGKPTLIWQPRFFDRIVRDEKELLNVRRYVENNPANWASDRCHPDHPHFEDAWLNITPDTEF